MKGSRFVYVALVAALAAILCAGLLGQGTLGSIAGRITDPSGGVLPGATVTLTNIETGQQKKTTTTADGYYRFPDLLPGTYSVKVELTGFQAAVTSNLKVDVNQAVTNDISMQVGEVTTSVEVQAAAPLLQRETASTGQVITTQQILEMPLNGRNFLNLALLVPGASENPGAQSQFSINGMRGNETSMLFDGVDARLFQNGRPAMIPSVDALQEFKIQQNSYSAAYGNGTAVVNSALRSGTNGFHGDAWEFLRNDALDTRGFFDPSVPKLKRNQFGFTAGGPIRKNKTFFFANYEGLRSRRSTTASALIPTPAELGGNLSDGLPIYDPLTLDAATGKRQAFANNIIPANRVSQFAHAGANIFPQPNLVGVKGFNYAKALSNPETTNQVNFKVDHQFSESDAFFARFSRSTDHAVIDSALPLSGEIDDINGMQALAHETHTFSPTLLNELTLGYTYGLFRQGLPLADHPIATQDFGLKGLRISGFNQGMPLLNIAGLSSMGSASFRPFGGIENNYQLGDDVTWVRGRHQIKFGVEFRQYRPSLYDQATPNGILNFDNRFTRQPGVSGTGNSIADFVLGDAFSGRATELIASNGTANMRWTHYSAYIQDDFKVMPKLTLNLGLRYDYDTPFREVYGAANVWSQTQNQFLTPGKGIDGLTKPDRNNFAPRFGFAYSATPRTVVRAGFGVFYGFIRGQEISSGYHLDPPFNVDTTLNSDPLTPTLPGVLWPPAVSTVTPGTNIFSINYDFPANYTYQWNLTIQRELAKNLSFQTAYVGSSSHKLTGRDLINQAHADADPTHPTPVQGRRPFTGAADISITKNIDQANYNALQVTLEKRTSQGLSFLGAYTYAKALGISEGGDQSAIGNEYVSRHTYYGSLPYDQRQRLTLSSTWELPLGRGKHFAGSVQGPLDKLVSGWNVTGIGTFFTGEHATPSSSNDPNVGRVDRNVPNRIGNGNLDRGQRSVTRWLDTSAFVSQPFGTFGDSGAGILEMPGVNNVDLALLKDTAFHERYRVEFRSEFFNAFNHPSFGQPNLTAGSASFGIIRSQRTNPREIQFGLKFYW